jgi:hypothetical protein
MIAERQDERTRGGIARRECDRAVAGARYAMQERVRELRDEGSSVDLDAYQTALHRRLAASAIPAADNVRRVVGGLCHRGGRDSVQWVLGIAALRPLARPVFPTGLGPKVAGGALQGRHEGAAIASLSASAFGVRNVRYRLARCPGEQSEHSKSDRVF